MREQFQQHDVHLVDGFLLRIKQFSQLLVFGLHGINLLNDIGQVGIGHDVVHNAVHKFGIGHERRLRKLLG